jgi:hypothetical protein
MEDKNRRKKRGDDVRGEKEKGKDENLDQIR